MVSVTQKRGEAKRTSLRVAVKQMRASVGMSSVLAGRRMGGGCFSIGSIGLDFGFVGIGGLV